MFLCPDAFGSQFCFLDLEGLLTAALQSVLQGRFEHRIVA